MDSPNKTRKVRFTLPEHENNFVCFIKSRNSPAVQVKQQPVLPPVPIDESKVHGTSRYVNGTLNFGQEDYKPVAEENKPKIENIEPKYLRPCIKPPRKSREVKRFVDNETNSPSKSLPLPTSLSKKFHYFIRSRSESRGRKKEIPDRNRKSNAIYSHAAFYFPDNDIKSDSRSLKPPRRKEILPKAPDILTVPIYNTPISLIDAMPIPTNEQIEIITNFSNMNINDNLTDCDESIPSISTKIQQLPYMKMINSDGNFQNFTQFFDRWRIQQETANRQLATIQTNRINTISVHKRLYKPLDGKSFSLLSSNYRKRIMNIKKTPLVTSLLRASKNADKEQLQKVMRSIGEAGISKNDLNSVDKNGRTALSYICITPLTAVLDFLLRIPGIDVNKADNEGNTPLHFAAEAGQSEIITMLTSRSRSIVVDAKNVFGMTPLMKAAIQGRTDCAKRLMLANASPFEKDNGRGLTAQQWARFCGRNFCSDAIGEIVRHRNVAKATYCKSSKRDVSTKEKVIFKSSSSVKLSSTKVDGLTFKLRNIFHRNKLPSESDLLPDLVNGMKLENAVPIVEVTPANNQILIKKYKTIYGNEKSVGSEDELRAVPKVPLRRKSCNE